MAITRNQKKGEDMAPASLRLAVGAKVTKSQRKQPVNKTKNRIAVRKPTSPPLSPRTDAQKKPAKKERKSQQSPLLDLPAELRNTIFEYALVEERPINVEHLRATPQLFLVSHQVRRECVSLFYLSNSFTITLYDANPTLLGRWCKHCQSLGMRNHDLNIEVVGYTGMNITRWAKMIYYGEPCRKMLGIESKDDGDKLSWEEMICETHRLAETYAANGKSGTQLKAAMAQLRQLNDL